MRGAWLSFRVRRSLIRAEADGPSTSDRLVHLRSLLLHSLSPFSQSTSFQGSVPTRSYWEMYRAVCRWPAVSFSCIQKGKMELYFCLRTVKINHTKWWRVRSLKRAVYRQRLLSEELQALQKSGDPPHFAHEEGKVRQASPEEDRSLLSKCNVFPCVPWNSGLDLVPLLAGARGALEAACSALKRKVNLVVVFFEH